VSDAKILHPVPEDDIGGFLSTVLTALLRSTTPESQEARVANFRPRWRRLRTWAAVDSDRLVATLATEPRTITIPGAGGRTAALDADALTLVSVAATHRRRGLLTAMLTESLQEARDRGDAVSILIAAEWPIYGRFGYAPAADNANYSLFPRRRLATVPTTEPVRAVDPAEIAEVAERIYARQGEVWPGQVDRSGPWWPARLHADGFPVVEPEPTRTWLVHDGADGPDGLLSWEVSRSDWDDPRGMAITVGDLVAGTWTAYEALWGYLTSIDLVEEVLLPARPVDEPARWLLGDGRALQQTLREDTVWVRLLDLPGALGARGYAAAGELVLDVVDPAPGGYAAGRVLIEADDGRSQCTTTRRPPDLRVTQRALASCYLGGHSLTELSIAGGVEELRPGALLLADAMFAVPQRPWNPTPF
jgi:predicted acetyltransferase